MQLSYMFLAESASAHEGKFFAFGGGLNLLRTPGFPSLFHSMAVVAGLELGDHDLNVVHKVSLRWVAPDGNELFPPAESEFTATRHPELVGVPSTHLIAFNLRGLPLMSPGRYQCFLRVDGEELGRTSFYVVTVPSESHEAAAPQNLGEQSEPDRNV